MVLEMENSRRPFDRSRDPGPIKKPRLTEERIRSLNPNARAFAAQRPIGSVAAAPASRFRVSGREEENNNDPSREAYQPQPINPHHELVNQYRSALSELIFNSKPMITNLTIIAGESLQAAKSIAATICNNILEVPNDQKLPSLYLLDSIVKNIGRDYIKYFAPRLPEVFIKAYRQVDPPTRSSMRHLFGTWKGVFHPQTLQIIEKELGVTSKSDCTPSAVAASRDPQPQQRSPHSIHVNPKYLERQHLQHSARAKGMVDDVPGLIPSSTGDADRLERTSGGTARASWIDPSVKLHSIRGCQRDALGEPLYEKDIGATLGEYEYGCDLSQSSSLGIKKISGGVAEEGREEPWYGARSSVPEMASGQRDGLNTKNRISNYSTARSANADLCGAMKSSIGMSNSWKNSEEEEFMWGMHSRVSEIDVANISGNSKNEIWTSDASEKLDSENHLLKQPRVQDTGSMFESETSTDLYSSEREDRTAYGHCTSSTRPLQDDLTRSGVSTRKAEHYPSTVGGLPPSRADSTIARKGIQPQVASSRVGKLGSRILPNSASGSARQSSVNHLASLENSAKQDVKRSNSLPHRDPRAVQFSGKPPGLSSNFESPSRTENSTGLSNPLASEVTGQSDMSSLLAAVMNSGILPNNLASGGTKVESCEIEEKPMSQSHVQRSLPSSGPRVLPTSLPSPASHESTSHIKVEQSPLPSRCSQSAISATTSTKTSDGKNKASDPILNLLNSLVSKGLISASKSEAPSVLQPQMPSAILNQSPENSSDSFVSVSAVPLDVHPASSVDEGPVKEAKAEGSADPSEPTKMDVGNLIGFQFRPDIIREFHPSVISRLFDGLPHQCSSCGIRLSCMEQLEMHLELHAKHELNNEHKPSWGWYAKADAWVAGNTGQFEPEPEPANLFSESERVTEDGPMVPADESQYACVLCGGLFEDYFSQEKDQWMFNGAVCMTIPSANTDAREGPIVHANCLIENSMHDMGFGNIIKQENDV